MKLKQARVSKLRKEIVKIKVDASCLSCQKSFMDESDDEKIFCEVNGKEVDGDFDCPDWECNFDVFNLCGAVYASRDRQVRYVEKESTHLWHINHYMSKTI